jgi:signal transduction histidine kinase
LGTLGTEFKLVLIPLYHRLVKPRSRHEDAARREFILNIVLLGILALSLLALVKNQVSYLRSGTSYQGVPIYVMPLLFLGFYALYILARAGLSRGAAYVVVVLCFGGATYTLYQWGNDAPMGLLMYAVVLVMAGVLVSTRFSLGLAGVAAFVLLVFQHLQDTGVRHPNFYWKTEPFDMGDTITVVSTLAVIVLLSWLANREIERSLHRAHASEAALKEERDSLEVKVVERTRELEEARLDKLIDLYRQAELGRLASGLFHDLVTPLNTVSLNLEQLRDSNGDNSPHKTIELDRLLQRAIRCTKSMEGFVESVRQQIQHKEVRTVFSAKHIIEQALWIVAARAEEAKTKIHFVHDAGPFQLYGNPVKFHQLILNLVLNAIDACDDQFSTQRNVIVTLRQGDKNLVLTVEDSGKGIPREHLEKIFEPFFTTKSQGKGIGIGLSLSREAVTKEFGGILNVESLVGVGTTFTVILPQAPVKVL